MHTANSSYPLLVLVCLVCGCESEKAKQARLAENETRKQAIQRQMAEKQGQAKELEQKIQGLNQMITGRERKWRESVIARHLGWSPERREQQIGILVHKWNNSNRTKDEDTVREMRTFASRWYSLGGITVDLIDDDYWDIARAKSANWGTEDQIKEPQTQLDDINLRLQSLQRQLHSGVPQ